MPLWLQGALEAAQAAIISALVVVAPIVAVWATAGFQNGQFEVLARLARRGAGPGICRDFSWVASTLNAPMPKRFYERNRAAQGNSGVRTVARFAKRLEAVPLGRKDSNSKKKEQ